MDLDSWSHFNKQQIYGPFLHTVWSEYVFDDQPDRSQRIELSPAPLPAHVLASGHRVGACLLALAKVQSQNLLYRDGTPLAAFQDVNGDNQMDIVVHVDTTALKKLKANTLLPIDYYQ